MELAAWVGRCLFLLQREEEKMRKQNISGLFSNFNIWRFECFYECVFTTSLVRVLNADASFHTNESALSYFVFLCEFLCEPWW